MSESAPKSRDIQTHLLELVRARVGVALTAQDDLARIGLDSLAMADLVRELEDEFGVRFDQDVFEVTTISDLAVYIERLRPTPR
ncbi:MAG: acyl carrier protein [Gammaproteobacteria bacterium]|nr:acyl carrier protein [Gammaproteobacteria bacterium]